MSSNVWFLQTTQASGVAKQKLLNRFETERINKDLNALQLTLLRNEFLTQLKTVIWRRGKITTLLFSSKEKKISFSFF
jgi:hypothetical protein